MRSATDSNNRAQRSVPLKLFFAMTVAIVTLVTILAQPFVASATGTRSNSVWRVATTNTQPAYLNAVACPSTSDCIAVGDGIIATTTNGGRTWTSENPVDEGVDVLSAIACPSTSDCTAVGYGIISTTNGGRTWTRESLPYGVNIFNAVACPSTSDCTAVGYGIISTTNGGRTWKKEKPPLGMSEGNAITCPSISHCMATGSGKYTNNATFATTNGGRTWRRGRFPYRSFPLFSIACHSISHCIAVGSNNIFITTNRGHTWGSPISVTGATFYNVTCHFSHCIAVGLDTNNKNGIMNGIATTTTNGGRTWKRRIFHWGFLRLNAVACSSNSHCTAAGWNNKGRGIIIATTNGGRTWRREASLLG